MIDLSDFEVFCRRSFDHALEIVERLGDERANRSPAAVSAPSPAGLLTHIVGVARWWVDHLLLGEPSERDRAAEFTTTATAGELRAEVEAWLDGFAANRARIESSSALAIEPHAMQRPLGAPWTPGAVLMHVYEEVAQHLGQLQVVADLLEAEWPTTTTPKP